VYPNTIGGAEKRFHDAARGMLGGLIAGFDIVFKGSLLQGPDAILTPAGSGDGFDQHGLGRRLRVVLFDQAPVKIEERLGFLAVKDDDLGEEAVDGAVAGGVAFALFCDGAFGAGTVGAGCLDLFRGAHCGLMVAALAGGLPKSEEGCH